MDFTNIKNINFSINVSKGYKDKYLNKLNTIFLKNNNSNNIKNIINTSIDFDNSLNSKYMTKHNIKTVKISKIEHNVNNFYKQNSMINFANKNYILNNIYNKTDTKYYSNYLINNNIISPAKSNGANKKMFNNLIKFLNKKDYGNLNKNFIYSNKANIKNTVNKLRYKSNILNIYDKNNTINNKKDKVVEDKKKLIIKIKEENTKEYKENFFKMIKIKSKLNKILENNFIVIKEDNSNIYKQNISEIYLFDKINRNKFKTNTNNLKKSIYITTKPNNSLFKKSSKIEYFDFYFKNKLHDVDVFAKYLKKNCHNSCCLIENNPHYYYRHQDNIITIDEVLNKFSKEEIKLIVSNRKFFDLGKFNKLQLMQDKNLLKVLINEDELASKCKNINKKLTNYNKNKYNENNKIILNNIKSNSTKVILNNLNLFKQKSKLYPIQQLKKLDNKLLLKLKYNTLSNTQNLKNSYNDIINKYDDISEQKSKNNIHSSKFSNNIKLKLFKINNSNQININWNKNLKTDRYCNNVLLYNNIIKKKYDNRYNYTSNITKSMIDIKSTIQDNPINKRLKKFSCFNPYYKFSNSKIYFKTKSSSLINNEVIKANKIKNKIKFNYKNKLNKVKL